MLLSLLIMGASARAAAASAVRAGFSVVAADLFADADLRELCPTHRIDRFPIEFSEITKKVPPGPWLYTGGLENHPDLVDQLARARPLWGNRGATLRGIRDPIQLEQAFSSRGIPCPPLNHDLDRISRDGSWLHKHRRSCGGSRIRLVDQNWAPTAPRQEDWYFQKRIEGRPCSAVFVFGESQFMMAGLTRQIVGASWAGASGFRYVGSLGPLIVDKDWARQWQCIGQCLRECFDLRGLVGVDAVEAEGTIWPLEVNPRYTASVEIIEQGLGLHAISMHSAACQGRSIASTPNDRANTKIGKAILFARRRLSIDGQFSECLRQLRAACPDAILADIPSRGQSIEAGSPIMTVMTTGLDIASLERRLRSIAETFWTVSEPS